MREIKFRAWSIKYNEFISIGFNVLGETTCFNLIELWYIENKGVKEDLLDVMFNDVIIEQFTGLKDKNEVDIYEGDVCKTSSFDFGDEIQSIVFEEGCFSFSYHLWSINQWEQRNIEIIGNIHENPELL